MCVCFFPLIVLFYLFQCVPAAFRPYCAWLYNVSYCGWLVGGDQDGPVSRELSECWIHLFSPSGSNDSWVSRWDCVYQTFWNSGKDKNGFMFQSLSIDFYINLFLLSETCSESGWHWLAIKRSFSIVSKTWGCKWAKLFQSRCEVTTQWDQILHIEETIWTR